MDLEERTAADKGAIHDSQTSMFGFSDKLYILTGTEYYSWDGEGAPAAVEGYIPLSLLRPRPLAAARFWSR